MCNGEIQPIPYQYIAKQSDLEQGRIMEAKSVDIFFLHVAGVIKGEPVSYIQIVNNGVGCSRKTNFYRDIESVVKDSAEKRHKRFGPLGRSIVLVLPPNNYWMPKPVPIQRNGLGQQRAVNFLIATEMFTSSQQGSIGSVVNEALLCLDENGGEFWVKIREPKTSEILGNIENGNGFPQALRDGLKLIYPEGVPSFGRSR